MRLLFMVVLLLGLGLAGFAVKLTKGYIDGYQAELGKERQSGQTRVEELEALLQEEKLKNAPAIEIVDIYVATRAMRYGERLQIEDAKLVAFPAESLPEGIFTAEEDLFPEANEEPRTLMRAIEMNEPILEVKVTDPGEEAGVTSQLEPGMRAFALRVDVASGVSGFLRPGDRVDIYWTGSVGGGGVTTEGQSTGKVTKLIGAAVQLIAVDQRADGDSAQATVARTVTVSATPQQVASLAQAQATGSLSMSLVGGGEVTTPAVLEVDQTDLLGLTRIEGPAVVEAPKVCTIKIRKGSEVVIEEIPCAAE
jgi:pilus assembly protein CpaB